MHRNFFLKPIPQTGAAKDLIHGHAWLQRPFCTTPTVQLLLNLERKSRQPRAGHTNGRRDSASKDKFNVCTFAHV